MGAVLGEQRHADVVRRVEEDGREEAPSGAVVDPHDQHPEGDRVHAPLPRDPRDVVVVLDVGDDVQQPPERSDGQGHRERTPSRCHAADGVSRVAHLLEGSGDEEHDEEDGDREHGDVRFGERTTQQAHGPVREREERGQQQQGRQVPGLVPDPGVVEHATQQPSEALTSLVPVREDRGRHQRGHEHQRARGELHR